MTTKPDLPLDPALRKRAKARASALGITFAEYLNRVVSEDLEQHETGIQQVAGLPPEGGSDGPREKWDISVLFDLGESEEPTDIARDKEKLIGEAVWQDYLESTGQAPRKAHKGRQRSE